MLPSVPPTKRMRVEYNQISATLFVGNKVHCKMQFPRPSVTKTACVSSPKVNSRAQTSESKKANTNTKVVTVGPALQTTPPPLPRHHPTPGRKTTPPLSARPALLPNAASKPKVVTNLVSSDSEPDDSSAEDCDEQGFFGYQQGERGVKMAGGDVRPQLWPKHPTSRRQTQPYPATIGSTAPYSFAEAVKHITPPPNTSATIKRDLQSATFDGKVSQNTKSLPT
eukprot:gene44083-54782_t